MLEELSSVVNTSVHAYAMFSGNPGLVNLKLVENSNIIAGIKLRILIFS